MVKIYTKTGDSGTTSLFGGRRVNKDDLRVEAYGNADELNALVGVILAENVGADFQKKLLRVQNDLFVLGADLATPVDVKIKVPRVGKPFIKRLENDIDNWQKTLTPIRNFILPGGSRVGSKLHLARTVARRLERLIVSLGKNEKINKNALVYTNRLSDWFFVAARFINSLEKTKESFWFGRSSKRVK